MEAVKEKTGLTNLQHEMLKLFGSNTAEEDLIEIKSLLESFFADRKDEGWSENGWKEEYTASLVATRDKHRMTDIQIELLKLCSHEASEEDLIDIKSLIGRYFGKKTTELAIDVSEKDQVEIRPLLAKYFAEKAMDAADTAWERNGWTHEDAQRMINTKMRTPYNSSNE